VDQLKTYDVGVGYLRMIVDAAEGEAKEEIRNLVRKELTSDELRKIDAIWNGAMREILPELEGEEGK